VTTVREPPEAREPALRLRSPRGRVALAATVLASATAMLDSTIVNVAVPHISADFGADLGVVQWVITGYLITLASCILLGGSLGDRFGRRRIFVLGAVVFAAASAVCAVAPALSVLVLARMVQGLGGALLAPTSLALTQSSFVESDRAAAVGAWSGLGGLFAALGPLLGGWLVDGPGWRIAFLLNVPVVALCLVASRAVPESRTSREPSPFDIRGAVLATVALGTLTWSLAQGPRQGWLAPSVLGGVAVAVAAGFSFVATERRASAPLVPRELFRDRTFVVLNIETFTLYGTLGVEFLVLVYQLQVTAGWSALAAGTALLPATALMLVGSSASGSLSSRIGPRLQLTVGPLLVAAALVVLGRIDGHVDWLTDVAPGAVLFGLGLVAFVAPLTATVMASVDAGLVSTASGVNNAVARTGGLLAVAVIPNVSGLATAAGPQATTSAYRVAMGMAAGLAVLSALVAVVGLRGRPGGRRSARRYHCAVDGPPLQTTSSESAPGP
jgi:EmrB/QacA subfamily drug resistance transporter